MMRKNKILALLLIMGMLAAMGCQKNYYTTKAKGNDCGCPSHKGMSGY